jgi:hypothetical protein
MNTKQRDVVYQRWSGVIRRETRDRVSLDQISARALADREVRDDPTLQSMIRADLEKRRAELQQELQTEQTREASLKSRADKQSIPPAPIAITPPEEVREAFSQLTQTLCASLERGDEKETGNAFGKIRTLQEQNPGLIPPTTVADYEERVGELRFPQRERAGPGAITSPTHSNPCGPPVSTR